MDTRFKMAFVLGLVTAAGAHHPACAAEAARPADPEGPETVEERGAAEVAALPRHACAESGTDGVHYETSSAEWSWSPSGGALIYDRAVGDVSQLRARPLVPRPAPAHAPGPGPGPAPGEDRCVTSGEQHDSQPSWSPDGGSIAFVRRASADADPRIHLLDLADGSVRPLTPPGRREEYPAFSPDGRRLAFVRHAEESDRQRFVVVMDRADVADLAKSNGGSGAGRVLFDSPYGLNNLSWTPDGSAVLLYSIDDDGWNDLYEAPADGSGARRITDNTVTDSYSPGYSGDRSRMVFGQGSEVSPFHRWFNYDLYEADLRSGTVRRLTWALLPDDRARYAPDGENIGFVSRRSGYPEIYRMGVDGVSLRPITRQPEGELTSFIARHGLEAAEERFRRVRRDDPDARLLGDRAAAVLAHRYLARNRAADAVRVARMGVATHPESSWARTALGRSLLAAGETVEARAALRDSLSLSPNQYQILFDLGFAEFLRTLDSIDGIYKKKGLDVFELARRLQDRGELLASMTLLRRLDAAHPDDPDVTAGLAQTLMRLGDHEGAVAAYRRALELDPGRDDARLHLRRLGDAAEPAPMLPREP